MVLHYEAASFHLPSVSTANSNTVQYTKPYQQYAVPTIPAVVTSKVLLPQSNIMAAFVHSYCSLFFDISSDLTKYKKCYVTKIKFFYSCRPNQPLAQNIEMQHKAAHFNLLMTYINLVITIFN